MPDSFGEKMLKTGVLVLLVAVGSVACFAIGLAIVQDAQEAQRTSEATGFSQLVKIETDQLTGCQYMRVYRGGITPRLTIDGKHMGCGDRR